MSDPLFGALALAAATVGSLHTLAPDHWIPFAALARAQRWPAGRTARVTIACGFGHVTVSALLGLGGLFFGLRLMEAFGRRMEALAGILLVGFGLAYAVFSGLSAYRDAGTFTVYAGCSNEAVGEVVDLIVEELRGVKHAPVAEAYEATFPPKVMVTDRRRRLRDSLSDRFAYEGTEIDLSVRKRLESEPVR